MDPQTLHFYEHKSAEWAAALPYDHSPFLDPFLDRLAPGARVLEMGCGDGREAARMIARGFAVDTSDGTPAMARLASERLGYAVPVRRFDELDAVEAFDAVWCQASLLHVPEPDLPVVLARIHRALKPGGWHWASYKDGVGGARDDFGRFFSYIPVDRLEAAYRQAAPWGSVALHTRPAVRHFSNPTLWHEVLVRK